MWWMYVVFFLVAFVFVSLLNILAIYLTKLFTGNEPNWKRDLRWRTILTIAGAVVITAILAIGRVFE